MDHLQNGHGRLIAASYCVRPLPGADPIHTQITPIVHLGKAYLEENRRRVILLPRQAVAPRQTLG